MPQHYDNILLTSQKYREQRDYWLEHLSTLEMDEYLDNDRNITRILPGTRNRLEIQLDPELSTHIHRIAKGSEMAIYVLLLTGFICCIYRYTGKENLNLLSPILKDSESRISFNDAVIIRSSVTSECSFKELLLKVRENVVNAYKNQDYPLEKIFEELHPGSHQMMDMVYQFIFQDEIIHQSDSLKMMEHSLMISVGKNGEEILVSFNYDPGVYKKDRVDQIAEFYRKILVQCIKTPASRLVEIRLLDDEDCKFFLEELNTTHISYRRNATITQLFMEQVQKTPEKFAVQDAERSLTYYELNEKADQVAWTLRQKGVRADSVVGIMADRSVDTIVGILGILKAGGAYLPIDIYYPQARMAHILKNSETTILLARREFSFEQYELPVETVYIDDLPVNLPVVVTDISLVQPGNLAYVIYTSGSTGKPKGVMIEHRSVLNLVYGLWQRIYFLHGSNLKVALIAPYVFDASVQQIFATLLAGHTLCIVPDEIKLDGKRLMEYYVQNVIDISDGTPTHLSILSSGNLQFDAKMSVKHYIIGGEALNLNTVQQFYRKFVNTKPYITNVYGPTECCVDTVGFLINPDLIETMSHIPIGTPMPNVQAYILDEQLRPVPMGVRGELYLSGDSVGRGYINGPELTAERFLINPFVDNARMYRTGDLVRWQFDQTIEFIRRIDHQVKIRGFRIELGEIESGLRKHEAIKDAVIMVRDDLDIGVYLCAYFVTHRKVSATELREYLSMSLPEYMIPSFFLEMEQMPLTRNGKVDRAALPAPRKISEETDIELPSNDTEEKLAAIWSQVLRLDRLGVNHNFFHLGGHSLLMVQVHNQIQEIFAKEVSIIDLFKYPTIASMARFLTNQGEDVFSYDKVQNRTEKRREALNRQRQLRRERVSE